MSRDLKQWLQWQETLHPQAIDLGLQRVSAVAAELDPTRGLARPAGTVVSVAGTNGKGSSIAMLEAVYAAAGYRTAAYTSPHLLSYNERLRLDGRPVSDADLCDAFERVDRARGKIRLTYFEFGTLAILDLIRRRAPDVALLEVGLGGRLDAVNIVDPDLALITNVALDHQQWLGDTREAIAAEKAGILRASAAAVFGQAAVPTSVERHARALGVRLHSPGGGYQWRSVSDGWEFQGSNGEVLRLPLPALAGRHQLSNAAAVVQALQLLRPRLRLSPRALRDGLRGAVLPGRLQTIAGPVPLLLDVAHNPDAAKALADRLAQTPVVGRTRAIIGVMADKDLAGIVAPLRSRVDAWYGAGLADVPRGTPAAALASALGELVGPVEAFEDPLAALDAAMVASVPGDRVLVFGSFLTVAAVQAVQIPEE